MNLHYNIYKGDLTKMKRKVISYKKLKKYLEEEVKFYDGLSNEQCNDFSVDDAEYACTLGKLSVYEKLLYIVGLIND